MRKKHNNRISKFLIFLFVLILIPFLKHGLNKAPNTNMEQTSSPPVEESTDTEADNSKNEKKIKEKINSIMKENLKRKPDTADVKKTDSKEDTAQNVSDSIQPDNTYQGDAKSDFEGDKDFVNNNAGKAPYLNNLNIPKFNSRPSVTINNNHPFFKPASSTKVYKNYSDLDSLNRVGICEVVTGPEYLPKYKRGDIYKVIPTGWKQKKYNFIDGKFLYNRCHLIGFQIAGDNANPKNLMTGTRYMNVEGMLPFENKITEYIKRTKHHVKYRVTPVFNGDEKVARGVLMEAQSVEDGEVMFNVFCYNNQPNVIIDYSNGSSKLAN